MERKKIEKKKERKVVEKKKYIGGKWGSQSKEEGNTGRIIDRN